MRGNALRELPAALAALPGCGSSTRANGLTTLPDAFAGAPALEKLDLRWNDLRALPPAASALERRGCFVLW